MAAGATFAVEINGPTPITEYDRLAVGGPVDLGGATLDVTLRYAPSNGQQFTLIAQSQGQPVAGTFAGLDEGAVFQVDGTTFGITYQGGSGHDVVLVAGPLGTPTRTTTPLATSTATETATGAATATGMATASRTPTPIPATFTPIPTGSSVPTPTATVMAPFCVGDCDGNGSVSINELLSGVNMLLLIQPNVCPPLDADGNGSATVAELIQAVNNALNGCPS